MRACYLSKRLRQWYALAGWGKYLDSENILVYYVRRASAMPFIYVLSTND